MAAINQQHVIVQYASQLDLLDDIENKFEQRYDSLFEHCKTKNVTNSELQVLSSKFQSYASDGKDVAPVISLIELLINERNVVADQHSLCFLIITGNKKMCANLDKCCDDICRLIDLYYKSNPNLNTHIDPYANPNVIKCMIRNNQYIAPDIIKTLAVWKKKVTLAEIIKYLMTLNSTDAYKKTIHDAIHYYKYGRDVAREVDFTSYYNPN